MVNKKVSTAVVFWILVLSAIGVIYNVELINRFDAQGSDSKQQKLAAVLHENHEQLPQLSNRKNRTRTKSLDNHDGRRESNWQVGVQQRNSNTTITRTPTSTLTQTITANDQPMGKFYVLHIGPSKTGTTSIQEDARDNPWGVNTMAEDKDNLIYVGKLFGQNFMKGLGSNRTIRKVNGVTKTINTENKKYRAAIQCMEKLLDGYYNRTNDNRLEMNESERTLLKEKFIQECWEGSEYMLSYNLMDSSEIYSYNPDQWGDGTYIELGKQFQVFDILGYERLILVASYRRYAEWVISAYTEAIKSQCLQKNLDGLQLDVPCTSLKTFLSNMLMQKGENEFNVRFYHNIHLTLPTVAKIGPTKLETKILNYFQLPHEPPTTTTANNKHETDFARDKIYKSITTEFYCDALGEGLTPYTCNHHRALERQTNTNRVKNKGATSKMAYQSVMAIAHQMGFLTNNTSSSNNNNHKKRKKSSPQDNIMTWKDLSDYHSKDLGLNWIDTMPLECLNNEKLEKLLDKSLRFEQRVMPDFYESNMGREEHIRLFWDVWAKEKKLFCWVDLDRLFDGVTSWDEIVNERIVSYNWTMPEIAPQR